MAKRCLSYSVVINPSNIGSHTNQMKNNGTGDLLHTIHSGEHSGRLADDIEPRIGFEPNLDIDPRIESGNRARQDATAPIEELEKIQIDLTRPELEILIGKNVPAEIRDDLIDLLRKYIGNFAWSHQDMVGINPKHACHYLKIDPARKPVHQKRRKFGPEKLLDNRLIEQAQNEPQWVANAVLVKKPTGSWRLCIDFTDLNSACPKDHFPMPHIDHLVDSTTGYEIMSFMDAFAGYRLM
ncbi:hypothetical protein OROMI_033978 [Orobanche minor]